jgi:hypothetical protein
MPPFFPTEQLLAGGSELTHRLRVALERLVVDAEHLLLPWLQRRNRRDLIMERKDGFPGRGVNKYKLWRFQLKLSPSLQDQ